MCAVEDNDSSCTLHDKEEIAVETSSKYDKLKALDPEMADQIHPNDSRKIHRYLDLYKQTGVLPSVVSFSFFFFIFR